MAVATKQRRTVKKKKGVSKPARRKKATRSSSPGNTGVPPVAGIVYGPPGVGKSDFCANWPNPYFIIDEHEVGINELVAFNRCPEPREILTCYDWPSVIDNLRAVAGTHEPSTVVVDSATGMESLCFAHTCSEEYDDDWSVRGFYSFQQGPGTAATRYWEPEFVKALKACNTAGHNVLVVAHSEVKRYDDPEGPAYERYMPYLHKRCWQSLHRWAGMVLFYNYYVQVVKEQGDTKAKPKSETEQRQIYTTHSAAYDAKNRFGLPPVINAGNSGADAYHNFSTAYQKCLA